MSRTKIELYPLHATFNLMESGKIIVPAFQRPYAWTKNMVRMLLESIYQGYPIGNITILQAEPGHLHSMPNEKSLFPAPSTNLLSSPHNVLYLLDGSQRLAALYNAFRGVKEGFQFWFDLEAERFLTEKNASEQKTNVDIKTLFTSNRFRAIQIDIARMDEDEANKFFKKLDALHSAVMSYELVFQILVDVSFEDAIAITERINASGRRLTKADIERAREQTRS